MTNKVQRTIIAFCESQNTLNSASEMDLIQILGEQNKACSKGGEDFIYIRTLEGFTELQNFASKEARYDCDQHFIKFIHYSAEITATYSQ